jgi:hypothetical protein
MYKRQSEMSLGHAKGKLRQSHVNIMKLENRGSQGNAQLINAHNGCNFAFSITFKLQRYKKVDPRSSTKNWI